MRQILFLFSILCALSSPSNADVLRDERLELEREQQQKAMNEIFARLEAETPKSIASEYGEKYINMLKRELPKNNIYLGLECRLNVQLAEKGQVINVGMSNQNRLCRDAFNTVWDIAVFPMPDNTSEAKKLQKMNMTLSY
ncbi:cell envelope integrity protein TolA [Vibrio aestuarianus]|uniref:cell envelope integrity protein TolA n=1 Tax=Vibrio aestuarianus TaxID=28171 RepID=UPI00237C78EE|nr:cell envelope integrity protein TolA [Vibrio aestuarianus]MDE1330472.1 cell envelope integrity protein TolA [Vibrio aestuarianus]